MIKNRLKLESYPDGVVKIYGLDEPTNTGNMPKDTYSLRETLRYRSRTVGNQRYFSALLAGVKVSRVLRCPFRGSVTGEDIAITEDGRKFYVRLAQLVEGSNPLSMDLSLEEVLQEHEFTGIP